MVLNIDSTERWLNADCFINLYFFLFTGANLPKMRLLRRDLVMLIYVALAVARAASCCFLGSCSVAPFAFKNGCPLGELDSLTCLCQEAAAVASNNE